MFTLAHFSDPHLSPMPALKPAALASKRLTGFINWQRKRQHLHKRKIVDALVRDLLAQTPDHIAITGDLTNLSLPQEVSNAQQWLEEIGPSNSVSIVPGNHDAYVLGARKKIETAWASNMIGDDFTKVTFPYHRKRGPISLIGLSSAKATGPFFSSGRLGKKQRTDLRLLLDTTRNQGQIRVILIHHPPRAPLKHLHKRLADGAKLAKLLSETGAELILHGHTHHRNITSLNGPGQTRIPVVGAPSASSVGQHGHMPAGYNLFSFETGNNGPTITLKTRDLRDPSLLSFADGKTDFLPLTQS